MPSEQDPLAQHHIAQAQELFLAHGDFLLRVLTKDIQKQDALDILQNLFLDIVINGIPENIENTRSYLHRAVIRDIIDLKRKSERDQKKIQGYRHQTPSPKPNDDPLKKLMRFEVIMEAFEMFKKRQSPSVNQVVNQKFLYDRNRREIAEKLNLKPETVDCYLSIGIKQIREFRDQLFRGLNE